jgi:hypothetical protein
VTPGVRRRDQCGLSRKAPLVNHGCSGLFKASWPYTPAVSWVPCHRRRGDLSVAQRHTGEPTRSQLRLVAGVDIAKLEATQGSRFHQPGRRGVLATPTPRTSRGRDNPCKFHVFGGDDRIRCGVSELGRGRSSDLPGAVLTLPAAAPPRTEGPGSPAPGVDCSRYRARTARQHRVRVHLPRAPPRARATDGMVRSSPAAMRVDAGAVAANGGLAATAEILIAPPAQPRRELAQRLQAHPIPPNVPDRQERDELLQIARARPNRVRRPLHVRQPRQVAINRRDRTFANYRPRLPAALHDPLNPAAPCDAADIDHAP